MSAAEKQGGADSAADKPLFRVTGGNPSATEVGVLAAVFAVAQAGAQRAAENPEAGVRDDWGSLESRLRSPFGYNPSSFRNRRQF